MAAKKSRLGAKRPILGDIVEIPVGDKLAYCQYVLFHADPPTYGELVRVFPKLYKSRPETFDGFAKQKHLYVAFIPLATIIWNRKMTVVASDAVPVECQSLPAFKKCYINYTTGKKTWYLWSDSQFTKLDELLPEHYDLPMLRVSNSIMFIDLIRDGWTPRDEIGPWKDESETPPKQKVTRKKTGQ